jgi:hypothetical protein
LGNEPQLSGQQNVESDGSLVLALAGFLFLDNETAEASWIGLVVSPAASLQSSPVLDAKLNANSAQRYLRMTHSHVIIAQ